MGATAAQPILPTGFLTAGAEFLQPPGSVPLGDQAVARERGATGRVYECTCVGHTFGAEVFLPRGGAAAVAIPDSASLVTAIPRGCATAPTSFVLFAARHSGNNAQQGIPIATSLLAMEEGNHFLDCARRICVNLRAVGYMAPVSARKAPHSNPSVRKCRLAVVATLDHVLRNAGQCIAGLTGRTEGIGLVFRPARAPGAVSFISLEMDPPRGGGIPANKSPPTKSTQNKKRPE
jgi:hypothetical protein